LQLGKAVSLARISRHQDRKFESADRQLECGFAPGATPDGGAQKQTPAQGVQFAFFQLAQPALQQDAQILSGDGQMVHGLRASEIVHAQAFDAKLLAQFLDAVFDAGRPAGRLY